MHIPHCNCSTLSKLVLLCSQSEDKKSQFSSCGSYWTALAKVANCTYWGYFLSW
jgi:hypothetical protein